MTDDMYLVFLWAFVFFVVFALILILVFYLFRKYFTWYWKQTKIVELLERIDSRLEIIQKNSAINELPDIKIREIIKQTKEKSINSTFEISG